jgi:hypothetical protein
VGEQGFAHRQRIPDDRLCLLKTATCGMQPPEAVERVPVARAHGTLDRKRRRQCVKKLECLLQRLGRISVAPLFHLQERLRVLPEIVIVLSSPKMPPPEASEPKKSPWPPTAMLFAIVLPSIVVVVPN